MPTPILVSREELDGPMRINTSVRGPSVSQSASPLGSPMRSGETNSPLSPIASPIPSQCSSPSQHSQHSQHSAIEWEASKRDWEMQRYEDASLMLYQMGICGARKGRRRSRKGKSLMINPEKIDPRAKGRESTKMSPLPRVSRLATCPAPAITVHTTSWQSTSVWQSTQLVVRVGPSWQEICELITNGLNSDANATVPPVSKLYDKHDTEITSKDQLEDGEEYFTHPQAVLARQRDAQGMNRTRAKARAYETQQEWTKLIDSPLISPQGYQNLIKGLDKRMQCVQPKKLIVRANRWTEHVVPPGDYVQEIVVRGTLDMLLADIKQSLTLGNQGQRAVIYQPDGQRVRSLKEMQDGQTVYMTQKDEQAMSKRDWGVTLCPAKARSIIAHANRWSDAPAPSRYLRKIIVPSNLMLLCEVITHALKTDAPVLAVYQENGDRITKMDQITDESHLYIVPHPDRMKASCMDAVQKLAPAKRKFLRVHNNYFEGDKGCVVTVLAMNPKLADPETQWIILMEECTVLLQMSTLCRKLWNSDGQVVATDTKYLVDGATYFTVPPPPPGPPPLDC